MSGTQLSIHDACDYIIVKLDEAGEHLSHLKLQKLLYFVQAWHLAINKAPLFNGKFQAWVHGPVNRQIYDRFKDVKSLYSGVTVADIRPGFNIDALDRACKLHIDGVLDVYAPFSGSELEDLTHQEEPWIEARKGYSAAQRCEAELNEETMASFYRKRFES
jgi:uncharacterized phage-associated protein